jgi:hypothetical protein
MALYTMTCIHCGYDLIFFAEPDANREGVRHLLQYPRHGVTVISSEDDPARPAESLTA